jgi:hypothetical protein
MPLKHLLCQTRLLKKERCRAEVRQREQWLAIIRAMRGKDILFGGRKKQGQGRRANHPRFFLSFFVNKNNYFVDNKYFDLQQTGAEVHRLNESALKRAWAGKIGVNNRLAITIASRRLSTMRPVFCAGTGIAIVVPVAQRELTESIFYDTSRGRLCRKAPSRRGY